MTIYTHLNGEKKENSDVDPPVVFTDDVPDLDIKKKTIDDDYVCLPAQPAAILIARRKRNVSLLRLCLLLTVVLVVAVGVMTGIYVYRYFARRVIHRGMYRGWCATTTDDSEHWEMTESVETDALKYEKIDVPAIRDFREATILHDFEVNYTAIVDKESQNCYVVPLNRSLVKPPRDFWDLISKLQSGYYLPDEEMVRENYRVLRPAVDNLTPFGYYIWRECRRLTTYRMERIDMEPMALVKREACQEVNYVYTSGYKFQNQHIIDC